MTDKTISNSQGIIVPPNIEIPKRVNGFYFSLKTLSFILCLNCGILNYLACFFGTLSAKVKEVEYGEDINVLPLRAIIGGLIPFGSGIGVVVLHLISTKISPRRILFICSVLLIICTAIAQVSNLIVLAVFRLMQGINAGCINALVSRYVSELALKTEEQSVSTLTQKCFAFGAFFACLIALFNPLNANLMWRIINFIPIVPSFIMICLIICNLIPESPTWLIKINEIEETKQILYNFGCNSIEVEIKSRTVIEVKENFCSNKFKIGLLLGLSNGVTGMAPLLTQVVGIMSTVNKEHALYYAPVISGFYFIGSCFSHKLLSFNIKKTILIGSFITVGIDMGVGLLFRFSSSIENQILTAVCVILLCFLNFFLGFITASFIPVFLNKIKLTPLQKTIILFLFWVCNSLSISGTLVNISLNATASEAFLLFSTLTFVFFILNTIFLLCTE